jgi:hypothetical protein
MPSATKAKGRPSPTTGLGSPLVGAARLEPGVIIAGVAERDAPSGKYYVGWIDSLRLSQVVYAPLLDFDQDAVVPVRSTDGYQKPPSLLETKRFAHFFRDHPELVVPPVLLNGRSRWVWQAGDANIGALHVYDSAAIVDGRCRIGGYSIAAKDAETRRAVEFVLLPSVELTQERHLHELTRERSLPASAAAETRLPTAHHPDRLLVSTDWSNLEIISEPYVVAGFNGYSVMLDVRDLDSGSICGLYASAKSLSRALEELRLRQRTLIGARIRLRKESDDQYARYELVHLP